MARQDSRWAPWWHYVLVIAVGHAVARATVLRDVGEVVDAAASVTLTVVLWAVVTVAWRRSVRDTAPRR